LNRHYKTVLKDSFPCIWYTKNMIKRWDLFADNSMNAVSLSVRYSYLRRRKSLSLVLGARYGFDGPCSQRLTFRPLNHIGTLKENWAHVNMSAISHTPPPPTELNLRLKTC
jgi:hypothetical protein